MKLSSTHSAAYCLTLHKPTYCTKHNGVRKLLSRTPLCFCWVDSLIQDSTRDFLSFAKEDLRDTITCTNSLVREHIEFMQVWENRRQLSSYTTTADPLHLPCLRRTVNWKKAEKKKTRQTLPAPRRCFHVLFFQPYMLRYILCGRQAKYSWRQIKILHLYTK